jgi:putative membrane protein
VAVPALTAGQSVAALHLGEFLPPLIALVLYLTLYRRRARTLQRERRGVPRWRRECFLAGALLMAIVQLPPLDGLADEVLVAHMLQHILIGEVASLLIVLGLTGPMLAPLLHLRATRALRALAHPVSAFALWTINLYVWHLPPLYQLAIRHDLVHALEHACLLWFGMLLWLALIGPLPRPAWFRSWAQLGYIFAVRGAGAILGNVLIWAPTVIYPVYRASDAARGLGPRSDQILAGAAMMVAQMLLTAVLVGWLFLRFARREEQQQRLLDLASTRGVPLSHERAARAVDAGSGKWLRARLLDLPGDARRELER